MTTTTAPDWTVGERLRSARRRAGLKQAEAARRIGVSRTTISNWEVGIAEPQLGHAAQMAALYGVPLTWLATGDTEPEPARQNPDPPIILDPERDLTPKPCSVPRQRLTRWELQQRQWAVPAA